MNHPPITDKRFNHITDRYELATNVTVQNNYLVILKRKILLTLFFIVLKTYFGHLFVKLYL